MVAAAAGPGTGQGAAGPGAGQGAAGSGAGQDAAGGGGGGGGRAPVAIAWAVDPGDPGPSLPPSGRSLFDQLIGEPATAGGAVPFPFAALVRRIEERLGPDPDGAAPLRRVLIPFSRSLQRNAASPEFWKYPRAVLAVDGERGLAPGLAAGPLLADRLFLGYQEKAGVLEVISYNEEAGRFEFQVVRDYREGGEPRVVYAQRALCATCHQNAAPIFSRQLWDETNANPRIAAELRRQGRGFYGFPVEQGVDIPAAFQAAADRANLLAVYQLLWRQGCGQGVGAEARSCRAALATAALQEALTGGRRFDAASPAFRQRFAAPFAAAWRARWPQGLAIPDPDLPNRDPLGETAPAVREFSVSERLGSSATALLAEVVRRSNVPARLEPLAPRQPLETWAPDAGTVERLVAGLAGFLPRGDVAALDRRLFELGGGPREPRRDFAAACRFELRRPAAGQGVDRVKFACGAEAGEGHAAAAPAAGERGHSGGLATAGRIFLAGGEVAGGEVERIALDGREELADLAVAGGSLRERGGAWEMRLRLAQKASGLHARRPGGDAVEELVLTLPAAGAPAGRAELRLLADFSHVESAIAELLALPGAGPGDVFGDAPFRRGALVGALFARLGIDLPPSAAAAAAAAADAHTERARATLGETAAEAMPPAPGSPALRAFLHYCSGCHRTAETSPPNFLAGGTDRIEASLAHCAERLFFRLSMWQLDDARRAKTPMPPIPALRGLAVDPGSWPRHPDLLLLTAYAGDLLRRQTGAPPRLDELAARGYEGLRACLPPAGKAAVPPAGEAPGRP